MGKAARWAVLGWCVLAACNDPSAAGGGAAADATPRRPDCVEDPDCPAGAACVDGRCVPVPIAQDAATPDAAPVWDGSPPDVVVPDAAPPVRDAAPDAAPPIRDAAPQPDAAPVRDAAPARDAAPVQDAAPVRDAVPPDAALDLDALPPDAAPIADAAPPDVKTRPDLAPPDAIPPDVAIADAALPDAGPPDAAPPDAFAPPPTPPRGVYDYERLPIGGLTEAHAVAFHPDGSYAVVLARTDVVHVIDWATLTGRRFDLHPPGGTLYWEDLVFDPSGTRALLVGWRMVGNAKEGVVYDLDDAAIRAGADAPIAETTHVAGEELAAIAWPWDPAGHPVVLSRANNDHTAILREYDPSLPGFHGLVTSTATAAGCQDLAFADNEFGGPGLLVVCGINGAEVDYYTEIGGVGEWHPGPPPGNLGNVSRVAAHPRGDYALVVSWSGRRLLRFEAGQMDNWLDAPNWANRGIWGVTFQQEGQRALVYGQEGVNPVTGTVFEYRHPLYRCDFQDCGETDVSIPDFDAAPYNAQNGTLLNDAAFRPGCDGGLLVGGYTNFQGSTGMVIRFQLENGRACR